MHDMIEARHVSVEDMTAVSPPRAAAGTPELRRIQVAMISAGLAAFALLYATQALLPDIGATFGAGATSASLTVSVTTGVLALTVVPMSAFAERVGRTRVMTGGLVVACLSVLAGAAAPQLWVLLIARAVDGLALGGVVAVAMGHIGAEVDERASTAAIGVYVSGTTVGGLIGRLVPAAVSTVAGWRVSLVALAVVGAACVLVFTRVVPAARAVAPAAPTDAPGVRTHLGLLTHLRDPGIVRLCLTALLLMGGFVGTYNYLTYRLGESPFDLSTSSIGLVFLAYLAGTVSSTTAARLVARVGRKTVLLCSTFLALAGLAVTLSSSLVAVLIGLVVFTTGFFGAHSVASGWVTGRATVAKSQASALYLLAYYLGSSVGGTAIGFAWTSGGWTATVVSVAGCYVLAAIVIAGISSPASARRQADRSPQWSDAVDLQRMFRPDEALPSEQQLSVPRELAGPSLHTADAVVDVADLATDPERGRVVGECGRGDLVRVEVIENQRAHHLPHRRPDASSLEALSQPGTGLTAAHDQIVAGVKPLHADQSTVPTDSQIKRPGRRREGRPLGPVVGGGVAGQVVG